MNFFSCLRRVTRNDETRRQLNSHGTCETSSEGNLGRPAASLLISKIFPYYTLRFLTTVVVLVTLFAACKKDKPKTAPSVTTATLTNITTTSATGGGTITSDGNSPVTASGIVLSKGHATPTLTDTVITSTVTSGSFTSNITGLDFSTTYYIRAYATNAIGTGYGDVVTLNTTNDTTKVRFTYNGQTVTYGIIISPTTGLKWMDRNLGASQVATSSTDASSYGDLYQWGRGADGHQLRTSGTTNTQSSTDVPGNSNFILTLAYNISDWRNPQNANLWQGVNGVNNPCPAGWRVPTKTEWTNEKGTVITGSNSAFSILKLPASGYRYLDGSLNDVGTKGWYWSSTTATVDATLSTPFYFTASSSSSSSITDRGSGFAIRCIKD